MKRANSVNVVIVCVVIGLIGTAVISANSQGQRGNEERVTATNTNSTIAANWSYARLVINGDTVLWHAGENNLDPEPLTLEAQYRRLGGNFRPNLTNLLNLIGQDGWELVATNETIWTFKRPR
jgi:hypothetical protein